MSFIGTIFQFTLEFLRRSYSAQRLLITVSKFKVKKDAI